MADFNFRLGSLDLEGSDDGLSPLPDTPIVVGRLSSPSGTSQNLFASPLSSTSQGTGGGLSQLSKLDCFIPSRSINGVAGKLGVKVKTEFAAKQSETVSRNHIGQ
jgi:hypothetical protein